MDMSSCYFGDGNGNNSNPPSPGAITIIIPNNAAATILRAGGNTFTAPGGSSIAVSGGSTTLTCGAVVRSSSGGTTTITLGGGVFVLRDVGVLSAPAGATIAVPSNFREHRLRKTVPLPAGTSISLVRAPPPDLDGILRSAVVLTEPWTVPAGGTIAPEEIKVPYGGSVIIGEGGCAIPAGSVILGGAVMFPSQGLASGAIVPERTTFFNVTIFPQGTSLPGGTTFSGGIQFPEGTIFPALTVFPAGTRFATDVTLPDGQVVEKEDKKEMKHTMPWLV